MTVDEDPSSVPFTPFQRLLLGTDGTVTHILEAYAREPIQVVKLLQEFDVATAADHALEPAADEKVLRRHVVLRGRQTGTKLLYAEAVVALGRVAPTLLDGLLTTDRPIGLLLAEGRTETFREILEVGVEAAGAHGAHFGLDGSTPLISRTYRIVSRRQPIMVITERFPTTFFRGLPP